jgi:copper/silver efflux system protein
MVKKLFKRNYNQIAESERMEIIERSSKQVSRGVFYSTIIIIASFLPVFMLTGQEGKLFHPLAYTKLSSCWLMPFWLLHWRLSLFLFS